MASLIVLALLALGAADSALAQRVRTEDPQVKALIACGTSRSSTFASLVTALDGTDVFVYVETRILAGLNGFLPHHVVAVGTNRYVRIVLSPAGREDHRIAVLAHELQHAIEIARAARVGRSETIEDLLRRIGFPRQGCSRRCYETIEAMDVERLVRNELRARRDPPDCRE